jgi:hypothetical protein
VNIELTKREADALGMDRVLSGTKEEIQAELTQAYYVWDDAPFPYWEKEAKMQMINKIAAIHGMTIGL